MQQLPGIRPTPVSQQITISTVGHTCCASKLKYMNNIGLVDFFFETLLEQSTSVSKERSQLVLISTCTIQKVLYVRRIITTPCDIIGTKQDCYDYFLVGNYISRSQTCALERCHTQSCHSETFHSLYLHTFMVGIHCSIWVIGLKLSCKVKYTNRIDVVFPCIVKVFI